MTFEISMGVRKNDRALKAQLEAVLARRQGDIQRILTDFGVPQLDLLPERGNTPEDRTGLDPALSGEHRHRPD
jgi:hypothetical protein